MGGIDHVVCSAGVLRTGPTSEMGPADLAEIIAVNVTGSLNVARAAHPYLRDSHGSLTLFASSSFTLGRPNYVAYSSSKAAVVNLVQGLAEEWAVDGIRVNAVSPERTNTPMRRRAFPGEEHVTMLQPAVVARATLGLLSSPLSGQVLDVRGGDGTSRWWRTMQPPPRRRRAAPDAAPRAMNRLEHVLASAVLRVLGFVFDRLPIRERVVLATARLSRLEGNLAFLHAEIGRTRPDVKIVALLDPYSYAILGKLGYLLRMARGMYYLRTSSLFIVDNAYLPVHVAAHRPGTTVVQVWHAVGAFKRFGADTTVGLAEPERSFLHRYYDFVICAGDASRAPYAAALRTPIERVLPLGAPRTDYFLDERALAQARERILSAYPRLRGGRVVLYAPTFRGRGRQKHGAPGFDAVALRAALPADHVVALKTHPNLDPRETPTAGFDVVLDPALEINEVFAAVDVLVTDYSSSVFEWALLRRPLVVLTEDLAAYERDPGLYLDYRSQMIGTQVRDADGVADAILGGDFDLSGYGRFIAANIDARDGHASAVRFTGFRPADERVGRP